MLKQFNVFLLVLAAVLASRLIGMALYPLVDTTEPRYAEIARLMAETGDWITPWFEPGVPFWGKPPLSFWTQALSIKVFGLSEFALRFPSWLATLAMVWLVWRSAKPLMGSKVAQWSSLVFATMALTYISAGAVITDAFLTLGTTLSLVSFLQVIAGQSGAWRWLFFIGAAIGLLAKGPVALVLTVIPITLWLLFNRQEAIKLTRFPWVRGALLMTLLAGPWYLLAEIKTPGFLDYFIVGEHLRRFLDPGWAGDLYGSAHNEPKGMIWVFWTWASFPWGIAAVVTLVATCIKKRDTSPLRRAGTDPALVFLLACALSPMLFFSLASNTIWTYILPSLPFTAILIGRWAAELEAGWSSRARAVMTGLVPILLTAFVGAAALGLKPLKTEKELVNYYQNVREDGDSLLLYLDDLQFSARFYSRGTVREVTPEQLADLHQSQRFQRLFLAVPDDWPMERLTGMFPSARRVMENRRYYLMAIEPPERNTPSVSSVPRRK
ncbi:ArnT family glycosyltransferase [Billgrantia bachuensis]|uniref:Glycosyltransferase family 39 protein n=1 Tax=Billgrantia bachuensis TaxID=2717286 RepID=A0ABX0PU63_9GAMM|nr:glycosyltransferase family 39 protein [Halomonas bachuensis]NIC04989.1 glycosyltransferase family 39 protein [Halomonas bachuensis]